jgi:hypothetical protein
MNEVVKTVTLPMIHKFGKMLVGAIVGFAATEAAEKTYVKIYECVQKRKTA